MASKVYLSKTQLLLIIQSTCAPMLWCYLTIFTVLQRGQLSHWLAFPEVASFLCMSHTSIWSTERRAAFIAYQETRRSLELHECKHDWRLMKGVRIVFKSLMRQVGFHRHAVVEGESQCCRGPQVCFFPSQSRCESMLNIVGNHVCIMMRY